MIGEDSLLPCVGRPAIATCEPGADHVGASCARLVGAGRQAEIRRQSVRRGHVAGLGTPDRGKLSIGGAEVSGTPPAGRNLAMVFQQCSLYPHLTVRENLAFPLRPPMIRASEDGIARKVPETAELLRISHKRDNRTTYSPFLRRDAARLHRPGLVRSPGIHLTDEPLSSLDAKLRAELRAVLKRIRVSLGATLLYVIHDQVEAMAMATRIKAFDRGRLVQFGSPRDL